MWILTNRWLKVMGRSACVPVMEDSKERWISYMEKVKLETSLLVKSKHTKLPIYYRKMQMEKWMLVLFGRILKPCHSKILREKLRSLPPDFHANHSLLRDCEKALMMSDISTHTSLMESKNVNQKLFFSKMSRELFQPKPTPDKVFCMLSYATWKQWVTEVRSAWKVRLQQSIALEKQHRIKEKESLLLESQKKCLDLGPTEKTWRTPTTADDKANPGKHSAKILQGKTQRVSGQSVQIALIDQVFLQQMKNDPQLFQKYKDIDMVIRKKLPTQEEFVEYLREVTSIKELAEKTTIKKSKIEHWFRKDNTGFSFPSIEDWLEIKPHLPIIKFDKEMTEVTSVEWVEKKKAYQEQTLNADKYPTPNASEEVKQSGSLSQNQNSLGKMARHVWSEMKYPTPSTTDAEGGSQSDRVEWSDKSAIIRKKKNPNNVYGAKLRDAVESIPNWVTPTKRDYLDSVTKAIPDRKDGKKRIDQLPRQIADININSQVDQTKNNTNGKNQEYCLNPTWVESLMGIPKNHTLIRYEFIESEVAEMESFHKQPQEHS